MLKSSNDELGNEEEVKSADVTVVGAAKRWLFRKKQFAANRSALRVETQNWNLVGEENRRARKELDEVPVLLLRCQHAFL